MIVTIIIKNIFFFTKKYFILLIKTVKMYVITRKKIERRKEITAVRMF